MSHDLISRSALLGALNYAILKLSSDSRNRDTPRGRADMVDWAKAREQLLADERADVQSHVSGMI